MNAADLKTILEKHSLYLQGKEGGARANLTDADLTRADFSYVDLTDANLRYADLRYADLTGANLTRADFRGANLSGADLTRADLRYADLTRANLTRANLRYANLTRANLRYASLTGADLSGANLTRADFSCAIGAVCTRLSDRWICVRQEDTITVGCQRHSIAYWRDDLDRIAEEYKATEAEVSAMCEVLQ